mgnify:FL=1
MGFTRSRSDSTLFSKHDPEKGWILISLFVDDCLITGSDKDGIIKLKKDLVARFGDSNIVWNNKVTSFLGISCRQSKDNNEIHLSAGAKIRDLLNKIGFHAKASDKKTSESAFKARTPWTTEFQNIKANATRPLTSRQELVQKNFRTIAGTLIYWSICVRSDIVPYLNKACRGQADPQRFHVVLLERLLMYANHSADYGLLYKRYSSPLDNDIIGPLTNRYAELKCIRDTPYVCFSDANFADQSDERLRSTTGWCLFCFGCLISWSSKRQTVTAKSTLESEIIAASSACDEACWFHLLVESIPFVFGFSQKATPPVVPLLLDNLAALSTSNHPKTTQASKHLDLRVFRIRDAQGDYQEDVPEQERPTARIRCFWCPTKFNLADFFSKMLPSNDYVRLSRFMVNVPYSFTQDEELYSQEGAYFLGRVIDWPEYQHTSNPLYIAQRPDSFEYVVKELPQEENPTTLDIAEFPSFHISSLESFL